MEESTLKPIEHILSDYFSKGLEGRSKEIRLGTFSIDVFDSYSSTECGVGKALNVAISNSSFPFFSIAEKQNLNTEVFQKAAVTLRGSRQIELVHFRDDEREFIVFSRYAWEQVREFVKDTPTDKLIQEICIAAERLRTFGFIEYGDAKERERESAVRRGLEIKDENICDD